MAVELVKSAAITNSDATPPVANKLVNNGGRLKEVVASGELSATASIGSIVRLCRVPSNARISRLLLSCDAITSAAGDIGVYDVARRNSGAVIDVDFFSSAVSLAAALVNSDITHEADPSDAAAGYGLADVEKYLWEALGLSADPGIEYDIAVTLTAAATAAGTVGLKCIYSDGN